MDDLRCECHFCGGRITRTEALVAASMVGGITSCLDCAEELTWEEVEPEQPVFAE